MSFCVLEKINRDTPKMHSNERKVLVMSTKLGIQNLVCKSVSFTIGEATGDDIRVDYHLLPGSKPMDWKHYVAVWEAVDSPQGPAIPWKEAPSLNHIGKIRRNDLEASVTLTDLALPQGSYIVGYSASSVNSFETERNFCASGYLPALGQGGYEYRSVEISVPAIAPKSVKIHYHTLVNYQPDHYGNWIGIWDKQQDMMTALPIDAVRIDKTASEGNVVLDSFNGVAGHSYVAYYFMDGWNEDKTRLSRSGMAAMASFDAINAE